ncbi:uncharacterized protein BX663DRAFT_497039 [Cokeromyces recurvatus]|uniref:uncharacterized protein n=1 Tax=Cokeromyces recurvatus TaxID=90255 RepID=UPI0022203C9E|nr:uncharacterized protein BX663DRAFT_497039 [Cokeromyces recurvatus]KAI7906598.1 hypothetical protein BX663DRAFT_497039 [Cokeromyces recurvatus]
MIRLPPTSAKLTVDDIKNFKELLKNTSYSDSTDNDEAILQNSFLSRFQSNFREKDMESRLGLNNVKRVKRSQSFQN